ncbi:MAG: YdcF family protein [Carboxylicivirga sp.]|nr:YdcF family protein [Carboxylicivirga sp.]
MTRLKKLLTWSILTIVLVLSGTLAIDYFVGHMATDNIYQSSTDIPHNKVGLLLGTAKTVQSGRINLYYKYRIDAAAKLYKAGKVDFILVSGDNSTKSYDEPTTIKNDLIKNGIPAERIYLDYAGFRTLDSVVRCKAIFGQESITVISQQFHNERALFLAKYNDIEAVGFNAKDVNIHYGFRTRIRESLARVKWCWI